jgi:hypothetical protein
VGADRQERGGVIVVRVWIDDETATADGLRARITSSLDLSGTDELVVVRAGEKEILASVREWLEEFRARGGRGDTPVTAL